MEVNKHDYLKAASFDDFRVFRLGEDMSHVEITKQLGSSKQRLCDVEFDRFAVGIRLAKELALKLDFSNKCYLK